jgi:hypothetical protein
MRLQLRVSLVTLVGGLVLVSAPQVVAQDVSKDLNLADATISFSRVSGEGDSVTLGTLSADLTHLFTDKIGVGGGLTLVRASSGGQGDTSGSLHVGGRYFLSGDQPGAPFAFARLGLGFGQDNNPKTLGIGVGYVRLFGSTKRGAGLVAELGYERDMYDGYSSNTISLAGGIALYFRPGR